MIACSAALSLFAGLAGTSTINQASGFSEHQAWSSITQVATKQISQGFSAWEEGGGIHFVFTLAGAGEMRSSEPPNPCSQSGTIFVTEVMSRDLDWRVNFEPAFSLVWSAGTATGLGWYTSTYVNGGRILSFGPHLDTPEEGSTWRAGVLIQGEILPVAVEYSPVPEPNQLRFFALLWFSLKTRRWRVFLQQFFLAVFGVIVT